MNKKTLVLMGLIVLLGVLLRAYNIGKESFWLDEGATAFAMKAYNAREILYNTIVIGNLLPGYYRATTDPPVYYITLYYWTKLFSVSETSLRFYSLAAWLFSAIFLFFTAKELIGDRNALLSTFLFSISTPAIVFSQEARGYMLYLLFALASMYYLIRALKSNISYHWIAYSLFVILGLYTHHLFVILLFFQIIYLAFYLIVIKKFSFSYVITNLFRKYYFLKIFLAYLIIGLLLIPIVPRVLKENSEWSQNLTIRSTISIFLNYATWIYPTEEGRDKINQGLILKLGAFDMLTFISFVVTAILSYSLIFYLIYSKLRKTPLNKFLIKENNFIFMLGWFVFPLVFGLIFSIITPTSIFVTFHYFFYCLPPFIMLLAQSMLELKKHFKLILMFFVLLNIVPLYAYYHNVDKQQWRETAQYMKGRIDKGEPVIISIYSGEVSFKYYFGEHSNIHGVKRLDNELKNLMKDKDSLWLILTLWKYHDPEGTVKKYIDESYEVIESKKFFDIDVYHYKKKGSK